MTDNLNFGRNEVIFNEEYRTQSPKTLQVQSWEKRSISATRPHDSPVVLFDKDDDGHEDIAASELVMKRRTHNWKITTGWSGPPLLGFVGLKCPMELFGAQKGEVEIRCHCRCTGGRFSSSTRSFQYLAM